MKKVLFATIALSLSIIACQKDDKKTPNETTPIEVNELIEGTLLDGGEISGVSLYCIENNASMVGQQWYEYYAKTKTVKDYTEFKLYAMLDRDAARYTTDDASEMASIAKLESEYYADKSSFILDAYKNYENSQSIEWPVLFTAYVNGEVTITCDKTLYGITPGSDLSKHFTISSKSSCLPVGIENPKLLYTFGEEMPTDMSELFVKESWLQSEYYLQFAGNPTEKYDELTLYLTIPATVEHSRDYAVAKYKGTAFESKFSDTSLKAECTIKFNWN